MNWAYSLPVEYLKCRDIGHHWDAHSTAFKVRSGDLVGRGFTCLSCGKERHDLYDRNWNLVSRKYVDVPGYAKPTDEDRLFRADFAKEFVSRQKVSHKPNKHMTKMLSNHLIKTKGKTP